ncbi:hypothetical protein SAMN05443668_104630 [Cryptosporangium aurantiacum]|uniref:Uncharacterized protein n=2 Tax=Cryptosporangium aurantiacum TaxID=134849 RepID=A0A1M7QGM0_9ACTN|nr:hypothetical protein SAMN05443668_104630 [Cryptosporangium aurantiacum]
MDVTAATTSEARIQLDSTLSGKGMLDGGWWPYSTDPLAELPALIAALDAQVGTVHRITFNKTLWQSTPRRIAVGGRTVRLGWYGPADIHELSVSGAGRDRLDLLVVPPDTGEAAAVAAMAAAARGNNGSHGTSLLKAEETSDGGSAARTDASSATLG